MESRESRTRREHKKLLEEQGIEGFLREIGGGDDYIRTLSIALAHFCFRNGPIESMHADMTTGLTDDKMKTLNKYMVDRLGLFFMLLSCEDKDALNAVLSFSKVCGTEWDDPNLAGELKRHGIPADRPHLMRQLLRGSDHNSAETRPSDGGEADDDQLYIEHSPHEPLRECPYCGSEILRRDARTRLAMFVDRSEQGSNKAVGKAAGVPVPVVSELQHYTEGEMTPTRRKQVNAIAEVLRVSPKMMLSFHPEGSTVHCVNCGATARWIMWNERAKDDR